MIIYIYISINLFNSSKKKGVEANHLLNIQFEKSPANVSNMSSISSSSTRRNKNIMNRNRNSNSLLTKNQFLQANYKFIISPCINNFDEGLYNPDCLISWELGFYFLAFTYSMFIPFFFNYLIFILFICNYAFYLLYKIYVS